MPLNFSVLKALPPVIFDMFLDNTSTSVKVTLDATVQLCIHPLAEDIGIASPSSPMMC